MGFHPSVVVEHYYTGRAAVVEAIDWVCQLFTESVLPHYPTPMNATLFPGKSKIRVRALFVGERIDVRALANADRLADSPLVVRAGAEGCAVLFRYGVLVLFELQPLEEVSFLSQLQPFIGGDFTEPEREDVEIKIEVEGDHRSDQPGGTLRLDDSSVQRLQLVADVLAKSVVLAQYERQREEVFDTIEPLVAGLQRGGHIGDVLMVQHKMVGRVEVTEKPDLPVGSPRPRATVCPSGGRVRIAGSSSRTRPKTGTHCPHRGDCAGSPADQALVQSGVVYRYPDRGGDPADAIRDVRRPLK